MPYSSREYAEMHFYYGLAQGNARRAAQLYRDLLIRRGGRQPDSYPDYRVFLRVHNALMDGRMPGTVRREGQSRLRLDRVDEVLEEIERDASTSTRAISRRTGIPQPSVHRILRQAGLKPYHIQKVQELVTADYQKRLEFCEEMIRNNNENPDFFDSILWTDESNFTRNGIFNMHNYHSWARENPHMIRRHNF